MNSTKEAFTKEIAQVIMDAVNINHIDISDVSAETSLMGGGLDLDSVDLLEAIVAIEHHYNIKISNADEGKEYFQSIGKIAEFVQLKCRA